MDLVLLSLLHERLKKSGPTVIVLGVQRSSVIRQRSTIESAVKIHDFSFLQTQILYCLLSLTRLV